MNGMNRTSRMDQGHERDRANEKDRFYGGSGWNTASCHINPPGQRRDNSDSGP